MNFYFAINNQNLGTLKLFYANLMKIKHKTYLNRDLAEFSMGFSFC